MRSNRVPRPRIPVINRPLTISLGHACFKRADVFGSGGGRFRQIRQVFLCLAICREVVRITNIERGVKRHFTGGCCSQKDLRRSSKPFSDFFMNLTIGRAMNAIQ